MLKKIKNWLIAKLGGWTDESVAKFVIVRDVSSFMLSDLVSEINKELKVKPKRKSKK